MGTYSKLATYINDEEEHSGKRNHDIVFITPHCTAGNKNSSAKAIIDFLTRRSNASVNYAIGGKGDIGGSICEEYRAWTSSSSWNDNRAITIEVATDTTGKQCNEQAIQSLIKLMVDICKRYNKTELVRLSKAETLALREYGDKMYITEHNWYSATACPGAYIKGKLDYIVDEVNKELKPKEDVETIYRVQVGTFKDIDNAKQLSDELKSIGYNNFIVRGEYNVK